MKTLTTLISTTFIHRLVLRTACIPLAAAALLVTASVGRGDILYWDGSSGIYWSTPGNWTANVAPSDGDYLVFPSGAANKVNYNNITGLNLESIQFTDGGYTLQGNRIGLTGFIQVTSSSDANTIDLDIDLDDSLLLAVGYASSSLDINGDINLGSDTLSIAGGGPIELSGVISGTGGILKDGICTLTLSGNTANSHSGDTQVLAGTMQLAKTVTDGAINNGSLTIGNGAGGDDTAIVKELDAFQIGTIPITIHEDGWLDVGDYSDTVGAITFNGGHAGSSGTGTLNLGGTVTVNASSEQALFDGKVYMGSGTRTFNVAEGSVGYELRITAVLSGNGLLKTGDGLMALQGANTFTGTATVDQGRVYVLNNNAFGTTAGGTAVSGSGFIQLLSVDVGLEPLTLGRTAAGSVIYTATDSSWAGDIVLNEDAVLGAGGSLEFSGSISGSGGIIFNGPGDLILSGSEHNVYTGPTLVKDGQLLMDKTSPYWAVGNGSLTVGDGSGAAGSALAQELGQFQLGSVPITVNGDGLLDLNNWNDTVGNSLTLNEGGDVQTGTGTLTLWANSQITVDSASANSTISGKLNVGTGACTFNIADGTLWVPASVSGSANITKTGGGYMYLQSANSFSGTMTVDQFYLAISDPEALGATGAGTVVNNAALLGVSGNTDVGGEPLTMNSSYGAGALWIGSGSNSWGGPVTLARNTTVRVSAGSFLNIVGQIDGVGGLTKLSEGTLILSGPSPNGYTGDTVVNEGVLLLDKQGVDGALAGPGDLIVGDGVGGAEQDVVRELRNFQIHSSVDIAVNASGLLDLDDHLDAVGGLTMDAGRVTTGSGLLTLGGDVTVTPEGLEQATIRGRLSLGGATRIFDVSRGGQTSNRVPVLQIDADVSGTGGLTKTGDSSMGLRGDNSYSGVTTVTEGDLLVLSDTALGSTAAGTVVETEGEVQLAALYNVSIHVGNEPLTLSGYLSAGGSGFDTSNSWAGAILLASDANLWMHTDVLLNLTGPMSGAGGFTKIGNGTLILSGSDANTYAGDTVVDRGTVELAKISSDGAIPGHLVIGDGSGGANADVVRLKRSNQIANAADVTITSSGLFDLDGYYDRMDAVTGGGSVALGAGHLIAGHSGSSFTFDGLVSGSGYLWKVGAGTWALTANNTYSGRTRIETGTLQVNGSQPGSDVLVQIAGTLGGTGTVGNIDSQGTVAPGNSPGQLGGGDTLMNAGSTFVVELNGFTPGAGYDQLEAQGAVKLDNASLSTSLGYLPAKGDAFIILNNDGNDDVAGIFAGLPDGAALTVSNAALRIDYDGGDGNDVALTVTEVNPVEDLRITSTEVVGSDVGLTWMGGVPFYVVETKTALTNATWTPITSPMRATETNLPATAPAGFYRVKGGN